MLNSQHHIAAALLLSVVISDDTWANETMGISIPGMPASIVSTSAHEHVIDLSLADAIALGLRENRSIRSAYLQRITQKFDLQVAEERFDPQLTLKGRYRATQSDDDHQRISAVTPTVTLTNILGTSFSLSWSESLNQAGHAGDRHSSGLTFTVIQPLLRDAGREVATAPLHLARLSEQINRLELKATVSRVITQIAIAYRELLRAQEQVRIAREALERSRQLLEVNESLIAAGRMAEFEIVQTQADMATRELGVEETVNQFEARRLELLHLLALDLATQVRASEPLEARKIDIDPEEARHIALEHQPEYLTQLIAREQAATHLAVAQNQRLWDVSLVGGASQVQNRLSGDLGHDSERDWDAYAGIQVEIPIGGSSQRQVEVRSRVNVYDQAIRLAETKQALERDIDDAVRNLDAHWRQYEIAQRARDLSQRKLDFEREKLEVGRSSNFQVLSYETDLRNAENAQLNALIAYLNAQTQLDMRLGMTLESWDIALEN